MSSECEIIHNFGNDLKRHKFPVNNHDIPSNGVYLLFEKDETGHGNDRIVRVGSHTGPDQLFSRLCQHFHNENKDRSIFRKSIGRALLKKDKDPFLKLWDIDLTTRKARDLYASKIDFDYQKMIERRVSEIIRDQFTFVVFEVNDKAKRLQIESKIISTVSLCDECKPTIDWFGKSSPNVKIVNSGLWQVMHLYKTPFTLSDINLLINSRT